MRDRCSQQDSSWVTAERVADVEAGKQLGWPSTLLSMFLRASFLTFQPVACCELILQRPDGAGLRLSLRIRTDRFLHQLALSQCALSCLAQQPTAKPASTLLHTR